LTGSRQKWRLKNQDRFESNLEKGFAAERKTGAWRCPAWLSVALGGPAPAFVIFHRLKIFR
jgi:hypothetical protein